MVSLRTGGIERQLFAAMVPRSVSSRSSLDLWPQARRTFGWVAQFEATSQGRCQAALSFRKPCWREHAEPARRVAPHQQRLVS